MNWHVIPNKLIAVLGIGFYLFAFTVGMPIDTVLSHTLIGVGAFVVMALLAIYVFGFGSGVAKLISVAFLWLGLEGGLIFLIISMVLTGIYGKIAHRITSATSVPYLPMAILTVIVMLSLSAFENSLRPSHAANAEYTAK